MSISLFFWSVGGGGGGDFAFLCQLRKALSVRGCAHRYAFFRRLFLRARSDVAGLVFGFQCTSRGNAFHWDITLFLF